MRRTVWRCLAGVLLVVWAAAGFAAEPPKEPILRMETGMHTATIYRIGVDAANRWAVSASDDKTVRLWELPSGKLVRVLRPPIGRGHEGRLYAVAISPDGRQIAAGGWTGLDWEGSANIYLFDRATGRITGLPNVVVRRLAFSQDGRHLAACLGGKNGIRIYRTDNLSLAGQDKDYGSDSFGATFDAESRLVTSSWDGYIRLYSRDFRLLAKEKAPGGKEPFQVSFSPDGRKIAVGFNDSTKVDVLSGNDLSHLYSPDTSGIDKGDLGSVSWSDDGHVLYAGGTYDDGKGPPIVRWLDAGRGRRTNLPGSPNTIMDIRPLKGGGFIYGAGDPALGVYDGEGRRKLFLTPSIADYRGNREAFLVANDGARVQFGYEYGGKSPVRFSVAARQLEVEPAQDANLSPPATESSGLRITDWKNEYNPKLNGNTLELQQYERSRSLAIAPDGGSFLLGTEWSLRLFDRQGKEIWNVSGPGVAWAVNIAGNGKAAVAAFSDGTIRWYRMTDGKELLAFFPHKDKKRWVLWTPGGYYDASEGSDELIGWHVNNGKDKEASFYPVARFFEQFYRPDVVAEVVKSVETDDDVVARLGASGKANLKAGLKRPPSVAIVSPKKGERFDRQEIEVTIRAEDQGGGIDEIRLYHNGKAVTEDTRGVKLKLKGNAKEKTFTVELLEGENRLVASAFSVERIEGNPDEISVTLKGAAKTSELHLVVVGINRYKNPVLNLNYAEPDAKGIEEFFTKPAVKKLFSRVRVYRLLNEEATTSGIKDLFAKVKKHARPQDTVLLYLAGHGDSIGSEWYFIPHDVVTPEMEEDLKKYGISTKEITETVKGFKSQKVFVMLDACKSGGMVVAMRGFEERKALLQLARSTGTYIVSASTDKQLAAEVRQLGHGVFTYVLLEGLAGKAGDKVTVESLISYVKNRLPDVTQRYRGAPQYPISWGTVMDFPIVLH